MIFATTGLVSHRVPRGSRRAFATAFFCASAVAGALFLTPRAAFAAPINYGSFVGSTVDYLNVTEDSTTSDPTPLFGAPIFSADSIDFNPVGFDANAMGAAGNDVTGARLMFMIQAHPGTALKNISFSEAGDTTLAGAGTDATSSSVTATGTITVNNVDGAALMSPLVRPIALTFTPSGGGYGLASDGGGLPIFFQQWGGSLFLDINQLLTQAGVPFTIGATKVSIDVTNTLTASSEAGTVASINKKDFGGISITVNIPEPTTLLLGALGLFAVAGRIRGQRCR